MPSSQNVSEDPALSCYQTDLGLDGACTMAAEPAASRDNIDNNDMKLPAHTGSDEELMPAVNQPSSDAVVPCSLLTTDVQQEAACRVAQYLS